MYEVLSALLCHGYTEHAVDFDLRGAGIHAVHVHLPTTGRMTVIVTIARTDREPFTPLESARIDVALRYPDGQARPTGSHAFIEGENDESVRPVALTLPINLEMTVTSTGLHAVEVSVNPSRTPTLLSLPLAVRPWSTQRS
ncbi:hypothetical protein [Blastococcus sp. LR1]|uniref:hypothetical protein n=1 Tax=Blastococcus sp. LR1 TaxID=2877000 RepID=UPI001CCB2669|nr:hypothetical protein [Blastococcus sp. LR1]MCA0143970.1 hypothetical protein [Blastococcus sp. LR1]